MGQLLARVFSLSSVRKLASRQSILFVTIFLLVAAPIVNIVIPSGNANAETSGQMSPEDQALSYGYYRALVGYAQDPGTGSCIYNELGNNDIKVTVANSNTTVPADSILPKGKAWVEGKQQNCSDILSKALSLWGMDAVDFVKAMGYTYDANAGPAWTTKGQKIDPLVKARVNVNKNVYGIANGGVGTLAQLPAAGVYALNWQTLASACNFQVLGPISKLQPPQSQWVTQNHQEEGSPGGSTTPVIEYTKVNLAQKGSKNPVPTGISYTVSNEVSTSSNPQTGSTSTSTVGTTGNVYGYNKGIAKSCSDLVKGLSDNVNAYIKSGATALLTSGTVNTSACATNPNATNCSTGDQSTCVIDGIGWIICPVVNFMSKLVDGSYAVLQSTLLRVPAVNTSTDTKTNGLYSAWSIMRNFANIAFVITFMIIIYSQLTGMGVTNYGIKKLLPKLIIAAILVNVSYWLCAIAVDISNILGNSLKNLMDNIAGQVSLKKTGVFSDGWEGLAGSILGGTVAISAAVGAAWVFGITIFLPLLICALTAVVTVVVVLTVRQVLVILLIVISPLAFVALLLPNTEKWFKRWREMLMTMLLMYPIIALIFGASKLASNIIMASSNSFLVQITGAAAAIIPLAITPIIMKTAGGLLGKIGGFVNNPNKGPLDRMRKGANRLREDEKNNMRGKGLKRAGDILKNGIGKDGKPTRRSRLRALVTSRGATYGVNRDKKSQFGKAVAEESAQEYFANRALNEEGFAQNMAGGSERMASSIRSSAQAEVDKIEKQDIANREIMWRAKIDPGNIGQMKEELTKAINSGDRISAQALQNMLIAKGSSGVDSLRAGMEEADIEEGGEMERALRKNLGDNHGQTLKQKARDLLVWSGKGGSIAAAGQSKSTWAGKSAADIASQTDASLEIAANSGYLDPEVAKKIIKDPRLNANLSARQIAALKVAADPKAQQDIAYASYSQNLNPGSSPAPAPTSTQLNVPHSNQPSVQPQAAAPPPPPSSVDVDIAANNRIVQKASAPVPRTPTQTEADNAANYQIARESAAAGPPTPTRTPTPIEADNAANYRIARDNPPPTPPENRNGS